MGELHLEIIVDRMKREFSVEANVGQPQVAYRETIRKDGVEAQGKFVRQSGGRGQYGDVYLRLFQNEKGAGFEFINSIKGGVIPGEYIKPIEQGIVEAMANGVLARYSRVESRFIQISPWETQLLYAIQRPQKITATHSDNMIHASDLAGPVLERSNGVSSGLRNPMLASTPVTTSDILIQKGTLVSVRSGSPIIMTSPVARRTASARHIQGR